MPESDHVVPIEHETLDRVASAVVVAVPFLAVGWAAWLAWGGTLHWQDLLVFAVTYLLTGLGVTVGFHRLFTHRSFKTTRPMRAVLAALGSAAIDAHLGWVFRGIDIADPQHYAKDLLADPVVRFVDRTFFMWVLVGLAFPFGLGVALTGSVVGGLTGLLWGGAVRIFVLHHATYSINSLCHFFGRDPFRTDDRSRNLAWLALPTLGEAWHNNHHAFPTSARHGLGRWQPDPSAWVIRGLERCRLATDVVRIAPERQIAKRTATAP
jgi:stearoyl-CoA desaturase (delta-9 desaturase)